MAQKYSHANRSHGGPGSQQDATEPYTVSQRHESRRESGGQEKTAQHTRNPARSAVSGGGGEQDSHHTHNPRTK